MWNIFGNDTLPKQWHNLTSVQQLEQAMADSYQNPVALFKHSTRCSRSMFAKSKLQDQYDLSDKQVKFFYLDLLNHRDVSNAIAEKLKVHHQSPQLIVLKDGKAIFHTSHEMISLEKLKANL